MTTAAASPLTPPRSDVLKDHILNAPGLLDWAEIEETFERQWAQGVVESAAKGGAEAIDRAIAYVDQQRPTRPCAYGKELFDKMALHPKNLPFLLTVSLRRAHPGITTEKARQLLTEENAQAVREAVLAFYGFTFKAREGDGKNDGGSPAGEAAGENPSTGTGSGEPSAKSDSTPAK